MKWTFTGVLAALGLATTGWGQPADSRPAGAAEDSSSQGATVVRHVQPQEAARLLADQKPTLLDLRTPAEYAAGHLRNARLLDYTAPDFAAQLEKLDRNRSYLIHCATGRRSTAALKVFRQLGFREVVHLDGGYKAWTSAGLPVER